MKNYANTIHIEAPLISAPHQLILVSEIDVWTDWIGEARAVHCVGDEPEVRREGFAPRPSWRHYQQ